MNNGWTPERRARQAALIRTWKPWLQSTGPRTEEGKARTAQNGFKGGHWVEMQQLKKDLNSLIAAQRRATDSIWAALNTEERGGVAGP